MLSAATIVLIIAAVLIYDAQRPACVGAQCFTAFTQVETQSCTSTCSYCGYNGSCSPGLASRANQACFLSGFTIGDMGGGGDKAGCYSGGVGAQSRTNQDGIAVCTATCVNFL
jgi:hypothetical protein